MAGQCYNVGVPVMNQRRGVVALGDSITRARGGTPALGIHFQSWAQWLAETLELPFTNLARDAATVSDVLGSQVPALRGPYDLGALHVGVNDVRETGWDAVAFQRDAAAIVAALAGCCDRVLVLTVPHDLGRPRATPKPRQANEALRRVAGWGGALVCDLAGFGGRRNVLPDAVHPTSAGELAIADAAARTLGVARMPSSLADPLGGPWHRARYEAWWTQLWLRDLVRRARERP